MTNTPIIDTIIEDLKKKGIQVDVTHTIEKPTRYFTRTINKIRRNCLGQKIIK